LGEPNPIYAADVLYGDKWLEPSFPSVLCRHLAGRGSPVNPNSKERYS
jgi:hypothetical protein